MKVPLTPLMKKLLQDKEASEQLQQALIDHNKTITVDGKSYKLESI
jgi:phosphatidylserine decarboxylase